MFKLRALLILVCFVFVATPALAVDDFYGPQGSNDSRRPKLNIRHGRGGSPWEESYVQDIDVSGFMSRLYEVMLREDWLGQYPEVKSAAEYLNNVGFFNWEGCHTEYQISGESMHFAAYTSFADLAPESYYGRYVALEDAKLESARYAPEGDTLLYLAVTNLHHKLMLEAENAVATASAMGEGSPLDEMMGELGAGDAEAMWEMVKALKLDEIVNNTLTGELALAVYGVPEVDKLLSGDVQPADFDAALFIGISDAAYLMNMVESYGAELGLSGMAVDTQGWQSFSLPEPAGMGVLIGGEMLIASTNLPRMQERLAKLERGDARRVDECQLYFDLNLQRLHDELLQPLAARGMAEFGDGVKLPTESMAYLLNLPESSALGSITVQAYHDDEGMGWDLDMNKALLSYLAYYVGVLGCGAAQSGEFF